MKQPCVILKEMICKMKGRREDKFVFEIQIRQDKKIPWVKNSLVGQKYYVSVFLSDKSKVSQFFSFYCLSFLCQEKKLLLLRPPAPTYPSAASTGRRNSISVSANSNLASMSNNTSSSMVATSSSTSRRRHVSMSSAASYGTPAASRGLPFYWT